MLLECFLNLFVDVLNVFLVEERQRIAVERRKVKISPPPVFKSLSSKTSCDVYLVIKGELVDRYQAQSDERTERIFCVIPSDTAATDEHNEAQNRRAYEVGKMDYDGVLELGSYQHETKKDCYHHCNSFVRLVLLANPTTKDSNIIK